MPAACGPPGSPHSPAPQGAPTGRFRQGRPSAAGPRCRCAPRDQVLAPIGQMRPGRAIKPADHDLAGRIGGVHLDHTNNVSPGHREGGGGLGKIMVVDTGGEIRLVRRVPDWGAGLVRDPVPGIAAFRPVQAPPGIASSNQIVSPARADDTAASIIVPASRPGRHRCAPNGVGVVCHPPYYALPASHHPMGRAPH